MGESFETIAARLTSASHFHSSLLSVNFSAGHLCQLRRDDFVDVLGLISQLLSELVGKMDIFQRSRI